MGELSSAGSPSLGTGRCELCAAVPQARHTVMSPQVDGYFMMGLCEADGAGVVSFAVAVNSVVNVL